MRNVILLDGYTYDNLDLRFNAEDSETGIEYIVTISREEIEDFVREYSYNDEYQLTEQCFKDDNEEIQGICENILEEWKEDEDSRIGVCVSFPKRQGISVKVGERHTWFIATSR